MADATTTRPPTKSAPTLTAALASSIRHHARVIDGREDQKQQQLHGASIPHRSYDEERITLSTAVERGFETEAKLATEIRDYEGVRDTALLDFVCNPHEKVMSHQQAEAAGNDTKHGRLSTWFRGSDAPKEKAVRFADAKSMAADLLEEKLPKQWGRNNFVAPPPTSFRRVTRHPSQGFFNQGVSRSAMQRRKRNDALLRFLIGILCFGISLTSVTYLSGGKYDTYMSFVTNRTIAKSTDDEVEEMLFFYPSWWEGDKPKMDVNLTGTIEFHVADVVEPRALGRAETPFFWLIPKAGGNVIRTALAACEKLVEASDLGAGYDQNILLVHERNQQRFVNVDMFSVEGLKRAKELNLATSGVPDVVISNLLLDTLDVFNFHNKARLFAVFRHPLERAVSKYYSDLVSNPNLAGYTLPQYVRRYGSEFVENNYITRHILGHYEGLLEVKHLHQAREFLRRKVVVGVARDLPTSAALFDKVFNWNAENEAMSSNEGCYRDIFFTLSDKSPPAIEEGSEGWKLLMAQNWFDMKVYEYVEFLYEEQLKKLGIASLA